MRSKKKTSKMFISNTKVTFQDQRLDDYVLENSVLKSKLQSKIDALSIMSKELDKCYMERDRYRILVEQMKYKNVATQLPHDNVNDSSKFMPMNTISGSEMLAKTREQNNLLKLEVETLRSKLEDATEDILVLRKELQKRDKIVEKTTGIERQTSNVVAFSNKNYEKVIQDLEKIQNKYQELQLDYRAVLEEKEELVCDRDYYKNKVQRLNHQISYILCNRLKTQHTEKESDSPKPVVDIDALVMENKYLNERITQLQVEKEIIKRTLLKYKAILENRNKSEAVNLEKGFPDVMTQKQVRNFLDMKTKTVTNRTSVLELKSLCLGLFEALNDKSTALQHQRKTNQILANRITELEKTLESWCNGEKYVPIFPAQLLLDNFLPEIVTDKSDVSSFQNIDVIDEKSSKKCKASDCQVEKICEKNSYCLDYIDNYGADKRVVTSKTALPIELEELVKEELQELQYEVN